MRYDTFDVIAPSVTGEAFNEAEVLGSAVWLWMHSKSPREAPLHLLSALLLPAIKNWQLVTLQGLAVMPQDDRFWFEHHPPAFNTMSGEHR